MKKNTIKLFFLILVGTNLNSFSQIVIPSGWMRPTDKLFEQKWRSESKFKYLSFGSDLNCDGTIDSAFILESKNNGGIGLFVFLSEPKGEYSRVVLYESMKDSANYKNLNQIQIEQIKKQFKSAYGIEVVKEGLYKTACGKGYYDCEKDEPEEIMIKCKGINFFLSEGANSFYYWDNIEKKFKHIWISD